MARGKSKKMKFNSQKNNKKHRGEKKINLNKKRKRPDEKTNKNFNDKEKKEEKMQIDKPLANVEESFDEEEEPDPLKELLATFNYNDKEKENIVTESEDEDEEMESEKNQTIHENIEDTLEDIVEEEAVEDAETAREEAEGSTDPFLSHFKNDLDDSLLESVSAQPVLVNSTTSKWKCLGNLLISIPKHNSINTKDVVVESKITLDEPKEFAKPGESPKLIDSLNWTKLSVKSQLHNNISRANRRNIEGLLAPLTPLQTELFSIINQYQDLLYSERSFANEEEIRFVYCLHAINHILKTRTKVLHHNAKLAKKSKDSNLEFQDQGLVRPKVLILVPFRDAAYRIINFLMDLVKNEEKVTPIMNSKRFEDEFTGGELAFPQRNPKPEDYQNLFRGNSDDNFRIGITVLGKTLKLYADFYSSDIIVASPLGLRLIIGAEGESNRDYDFLASIEMLILDQADVFFMQNWDHILHIFKHLHVQPKSLHGTDVSRVRSWAINGWTKYYRQTLIFSSVHLAALNALLMRQCQNFAGKIVVRNPIEPGTFCQVLVTLPQTFHRIDANSSSTAAESRFETLTRRILPHMNSNNTLIYVPSYFDYVQIRNYLKREDINFAQICEYSKEGKVAKARDLFFHSERRYLLYSERMHFFKRLRIKGIRHLIFYQPPVYPHFYSEMANLMQEANQNPRPEGGSASEMSVTTLFTRYDSHQLAGIVGTERAGRLIHAEGNVHVFTSTDK